MAPLALRQLAYLVLALLTTLSVSGCASQSDAQAAQLQEMSQQIRRLQSTTDRLEERISAMEVAQRATALSRKANAPTSTAAVAPSDLPMVKMDPRANPDGTSLPSDGTEPDEPRTLIVGEGARVEARSSQDAPGSSLTKRGKDKATPEPNAKKQKSVSETGSTAP